MDKPIIVIPPPIIFHSYCDMMNCINGWENGVAERMVADWNAWEPYREICREMSG